MKAPSPPPTSAWLSKSSSCTLLPPRYEKTWLPLWETLSLSGCISSVKEAPKPLNPFVPQTHFIPHIIWLPLIAPTFPTANKAFIQCLKHILENCVQSGARPWPDHRMASWRPCGQPHFLSREAPGQPEPSLPPHM